MSEPSTPEERMADLLQRHPTLTEMQINGLIHLMRNLQPPYVDEKPITDEEWRQLRGRARQR